jgi:hypothetical protein
VPVGSFVFSIYVDSGSYVLLDRVLYTPERMVKIAAEAAKPDGVSVLSLNDRIGLVHDAMALSKAGLAKLSSALTLLDGLKGETECQSLNVPRCILHTLMACRSSDRSRLVWNCG